MEKYTNDKVALGFRRLSNYCDLRGGSQPILMKIKVEQLDF